DPGTAQQFARSRTIYALGMMVSTSYAVLFLAGVVVTWRQGRSVGLSLLLILYVPATIAPMLTNMRYTVTIQPLVFMFMAAAIIDRLARTESSFVNDVPSRQA